MVRRVLAYAIYPLLTGGAVAFCVWALGRGWPAWAIGVAVVGASAAAVEGLERLIPYRRAWSVPRGDRATDLWHFAISNRAFDLGAFVAISAFVPLGGALTSWLGFTLWPHAWPLAAQAALALALVELPWYWVHRLEHTSPLLWRLHAVHHSAQRMYWWNVARNHPLDNFVSAAASVALLALAGAGEAPLALVAAFSGAHAMLQHSNVDQRTGFLDLFFTTARVHRWHHSPRLEESRANYCPTITLWDWVFGTRRFDAAAEPPVELGIGPEPATFPAGYAAQLRSPFDPTLWRR